MNAPCVEDTNATCVIPKTQTASVRVRVKSMKPKPPIPQAEKELPPPPTTSAPKKEKEPAQPKPSEKNKNTPEVVRTRTGFLVTGENLLIIGIAILVVLALVGLGIWAINSGKQVVEEGVKATSTTTSLNFNEEIRIHQITLFKGQMETVTATDRHCLRWPEGLPVLVHIHNGKEFGPPIKSAQLKEGAHQTGVVGFSIDPEKWDRDILAIRIRDVPYGHPDTVKCRPKENS